MVWGLIQPNGTVHKSTVNIQVKLIGYRMGIDRKRQTLGIGSDRIGIGASLILYHKLWSWIRRYSIGSNKRSV